MKPEVYIIVAADEKGGIGKSGKLPWHFKKEMQFFKEITAATTDPAKQNIVIMGRATWQSIPEKFRPLPKRKNVILTHQNDFSAPGAQTANSLDNALDLAHENESGSIEIEKIFIIGGAKVFAEAVEHPSITGIYLTKIKANYNCDTFFSEMPEKFSNKKLLKSDQEEGVSFDYYLYLKPRASTPLDR